MVCLVTGATGSVGATGYRGATGASGLVRRGKFINSVKLFSGKLVANEIINSNNTPCTCMINPLKPTVAIWVQL